MLRTRTCFQTEVKGNSEIAYWNHLHMCSVFVWTRIVAECTFLCRRIAVEKKPGKPELPPESLNVSASIDLFKSAKLFVARLRECEYRVSNLSNVHL